MYSANARKLTVPLSPGTYRQFAVRCKEKDTDMTAVVRGWIDGFLLNEK